MTLIVDNSKSEECVTSLLDFISVFDLEDKALQYFDDVEDVQDILESKKFVCDGEHIAMFLENMDRVFKLRFVDDRHDGYWIINEIG